MEELSLINQSGVAELTVDLSELSYIDPTGLSLLAVEQRRASASGMTLHIASGRLDFSSSGACAWRGTVWMGRRARRLGHGATRAGGRRRRPTRGGTVDRRVRAGGHDPEASRSSKSRRCRSWVGLENRAARGRYGQRLAHADEGDRRRRVPGPGFLPPKTWNRRPRPRSLARESTSRPATSRSDLDSEPHPVPRALVRRSTYMTT